MKVNDNIYPPSMFALNQNDDNNQQNQNFMGNAGNNAYNNQRR